MWDLKDSDLTSTQSKTLPPHLLMITMTPGAYKTAEFVQFLLSDVPYDITR